MKEELLRELLLMQERGDMSPFYAKNVWKEKAKEVRRFDRYECQQCKARGRYARGVIVHHVKHLEDRPDLAIDIFDPGTGERQLVTLCKLCHEEQHPDALIANAPAQPITAERWD